MINPVFERHLRRQENWTLGDAFAKALPILDGTYNLKSGNRTLLGGSGSSGRSSGTGSGSGGICGSSASRIDGVPECNR